MTGAAGVDPRDARVAAWRPARRLPGVRARQHDVAARGAGAGARLPARVPAARDARAGRAWHARASAGDAHAVRGEPPAARLRGHQRAREAAGRHAAARADHLTWTI